MPVFSCGRSLYIDWRMVVVARGECPASCKKGGGIVWAGEFRGQYVRGEMSRGNVLRSYRDTRHSCVSSLELQ